MFVTSDEEDPDEDGAVDYKYGLAHNHRLLGAVTEASYALSGFFVCNSRNYFAVFFRGGKNSAKRETKCRNS